ncbi:MAG: hypothetical protein F9K25_11905 [Candidatus Contendobacter sp.]|nr:MAG: hypothetical protein F9K25_11905 [Candidatus Contendobacter sp.]
MFVVLVLGFLHLISMQSAHAALMADLEGPTNNQPVSGIGIIRGWAFSDSAGVRISQATLRIDGKDITAIPCCSVRADVQSAFPQFPAENTRNSGFGITFNYGNLTAGAHTIAVTIQDSSGARFERAHTVTVVKAGDFSYIDRLNLDGASAERQGQDVVIAGLRVRDKASQQEKRVNARLRWFQNTQALGLVEASSSTAAAQAATPENKLGTKAEKVQPTSAAASLQYAALESPNHGDTGSGIAVVRGWAVAPAGRAIQRVQLFVDGEPSMTIPCCSYRSDVAAALPGESNAANSGFGVTFNYGNLRAGVHSMTVEIEDSSGALRKFVRGILVRNPGDFSFLEQLDLGAAQVRITGGQLVIEGALARDKATGQTAQRNLRFQWNNPAQAFALSEESVKDATVADLSCNVDGDTSSLENLKNNPGSSGISLVELITAINRAGAGSGRVFIGFEREGSITCSNDFPEINAPISINGDINGDGIPDIDIQGGNRDRTFKVRSSDVTIQQFSFQGVSAFFRAVGIYDHDGLGISNVAVLNNKMTNVYRGFSVDLYDRLTLSNLLISNNFISNEDDNDNVIEIETSLHNQDHYKNLVVANNRIENGDIAIDLDKNDAIIHDVSIIDNIVGGNIRMGTFLSSARSTVEIVVIGNQVNSPNGWCMFLAGSSDNSQSNNTLLAEFLDNTISCGLNISGEGNNELIQAVVKGNRFLNGEVISYNSSGGNNTIITDILSNQFISNSVSSSISVPISLNGGSGGNNNKVIVKIHDNDLSDSLPVGKNFTGVSINGGVGASSNNIITGEITYNRINTLNNSQDYKTGLSVIGGYGFSTKDYIAKNNTADMLANNNEFRNLKDGVKVFGGYSKNNSSTDNKVFSELHSNLVENSRTNGINIIGGDRDQGSSSTVVGNEIQAKVTNNVTDGIVCKDNIPGNTAKCVLSGNTDTSGGAKSAQAGYSTGMSHSAQQQLAAHMEQIGIKEQQLRERAATISDPRLQKRLLDLSDRLYEMQHKMSARMAGVPLSALSDQMER